MNMVSNSRVIQPYQQEPFHSVHTQSRYNANTRLASSTMISVYEEQPPSYEAAVTNLLTEQ